MEEAKQRAIKRDIPKGAIIMTKYEALTHQATLIQNWKKQSEVWPLIHGTGIMSIAAALGSAYINFQFRRKLKLRNIGQLPSMVTLTGGPALLTGLFQTQIVHDKLLLLEISCPLCLELRSILIQTSCGLLMPLLAVPLINFVVVGSGVHNMPYAHEGRKIFTILRSVYQPMIPKLSLIFILHAMLGGYITYLKTKSFLRVLDITYLMEEEKTTRKYVEE